MVPVPALELLVPDFQRRRPQNTQNPRNPPLHQRRPQRPNQGTAPPQGGTTDQGTAPQQGGTTDQGTAPQQGTTQQGTAQQGVTGDTAGQGADYGALATTERTRVATAAISGLPAAVTSTTNADLRTRVQTAVRSAAVAAFDACVAEVLAEANRTGQQATQQEVTSARTAYDQGPGLAVGKFGTYLDEARGRATATDAHLESALQVYTVRTGRSVRVYTGIQANDDVTLLDYHVSGVSDDATAADNIQDIVEGNLIERSAYGNAPGGETGPNDTVLDAIITLSATYSFRITELAGGSHSRNSAHYPGDAIDVDLINGVAVNSRNTHVAGFKQACRDLGATLVLGPGDSGHSTHIHAQW